MPRIPELSWGRKVVSEFGTNLGYMVRLSQKQTTKIKSVLCHVSLPNITAARESDIEYVSDLLSLDADYLNILLFFRQSLMYITWMT